MEFQAAVITVSDQCFWGEERDQCGPLIASLLEAAGCRVALQAIVQDEQWQIEQELIKAADQMGLTLAVTVGGTGFAPRDVTPEATARVCPRLVPGIAEAMRAAGLAHTPRAMLSRGIAGIRGRTLVLNLPGKPEAARQNLQGVLPVLPHALAMLCRGQA